MIVQMSNQNVFGDRLELNAFQVEVELPIACGHFALRDYNNFRDVDGVLNEKVDGLGNDLLNIDLWNNLGKFALCWSSGNLNLLDDLLDVLWFLQIVRPGKSLKLLEHA